MTRKPLLVLGSPSGGTSAVSGVLQRLGFNMLGRPQNPHALPQPNRQYIRFECQKCWDDVLHHVWPFRNILPELGNLEYGVSLMDRYLKARMAKQARVGVKHARLAFLGFAAGQLETEFEWIQVYRPHEEVVASIAKYSGQAGCTDAARLGVLSLGRQKLAEKVPPLTEVSYGALLDDPACEIGALCEALRFEPLSQNFDAAVRLIEEYKSGREAK